MNEDQERIKVLENQLAHLIFCIRDGMSEIGHERIDMLGDAKEAERLLDKRGDLSCKHSELALCKNCADGILPSKKR